MQLIGFQAENGRFEYLRFQQSQERQGTVHACHRGGNQGAPGAAQDGIGRGHRIQRPVTVRRGLVADCGLVVMVRPDGVPVAVGRARTVDSALPGRSLTGPVADGDGDLLLRLLPALPQRRVHGAAQHPGQPLHGTLHRDRHHGGHRDQQGHVLEQGVAPVHGPPPLAGRLVGGRG